MTVPVVNEQMNAPGQVAGVLEVAVSKESTLDDGEPDLDLIHPRSVDRREDEMEPIAVASVEFRPAFVGAVFVCIKVVPDDIDVALRILPGQGLHELDSLVRGALGNDTPEDFARASIEGSDQAARSVADVLVLETNGPIRSSFSGMPTNECLQWLFIDADDLCSLGRVKVELTDAISLLSEIQVAAVKPHPNVVRPELMKPKDSSHLGNAQLPPRDDFESMGQRFVSPHLAEGGQRIVGALAGQLHELTPNDQWNC